MLAISENFISTEIQTRESGGYSCDELKGYKTDLANLQDLIAYIEEGKRHFQKDKDGDIKGGLSKTEDAAKTQELSETLRNNLKKTTHPNQSNFSDFEKYCEHKYGKDTMLYNLIIGLLKKIKAHFVLLQKDTKWVSNGKYKNFIAIKTQNKNFCITIRDKYRTLKAKTFQIKPDRNPYVRFNIERMEQLEEAAIIINASIKNV